MIKKMMALLAAISCAIGAWADGNVHLSGTDFSGLDAGSFVTGRDDSGQDSGSTYWFVGDTADFEGTIVTSSSGKNFLDFESNITNPLYRTISGCYNKTSPSQFGATPIGTGLFIDTTVQFTPYLVNENHPAPTAVTAEDKLIVWVRETEVEDGANVTNLIVTAGYYDAFDGLSASNYVVNLTSAQVSEICSHTNRLTIKSYSCLTDTAGGPAGFVVYLNEQALEYEGDAFAAGCTYLDDLAATPESYYESGHHKLFPSLMGNLDNYNEISGVGYAGMGKIGDVFFDTYSTAYPAFAADPIKFRVVPGDGVESYVYDNVTYTSEQSFSVAPSVASVIISNVVYSSGWQHKPGTWYNGTTIVNNAEGVGGDYGTFFFTGGTTLNLAGFQANYTVGGESYQTLFGGSVTEPTGAYAAAKNAGTIVLNNDITITEGDKQIKVGLGDVLTIDLNGHTIRGTAEDASIVNGYGGSLTIIDSSDGQTGKVLGCLIANPDYDPKDPGSELLVNNYKAVTITENAASTKLNAGTYDLIEKHEGNNTLVISKGSYLCESESGLQPAEFYLKGSVALDATVSWSRDPDTAFWYATVSSETPVTTYAVTFSTNNIPVAEHNTNIAAGEKLPVDAIPAFTGGAWDVDPTNAVINAATNFNYTIPPADPWAPDSKTDEAAYNKVVEVFGEAVAEKIHTYDAYINMVSYLAGKGTNPDDFKTGGAYAAAAPYVYQSYILGADELFTAEPKVTVTAVAANATTAGTGMWDFTVKVTEGKSTDAYSVAADKVAALVKIRTSLTTGTWDAPTADNIEADKVDGGNLIKVTINFGNGTSGFMKVAE